MTILCRYFYSKTITQVHLSYKPLSLRSAIKEVLSVLMLCASSDRRRPFSYHKKMANFRFLVKKNWHKLRKNVLNMASSDSQIDKPQRGCPKRAELPGVNRNTGAQSIILTVSLIHSIQSPRLTLHYACLTRNDWLKDTAPPKGFSQSKFS